jgi:plasmid stabilization system protein ParE
VTLVVVFRPEAQDDALVVRDWYEERQANLGAEFVAQLSAVINRIAEHPLMSQRVRGETRRAVLDQFPYAVYFRPTATEVVVLAVHGRQHPVRWQRRK